MNSPDFVDVAIALILVAVSIAVSRWWKIPVQKDMAFGSVRAFVQLVAVGYALEYIFDMESPWLILMAIAIMLGVGAWVAADRAPIGKGALAITLTAMILGSLGTLGLMLAVGLIDFEARYVIPLAGMLISNSMNAATLTIRRIATDISDHRLAIESALALGKSWRESTRRYQREAAMTGMISILNFMKTVGIVALPGAMTGMILAGAEPLQAVLLQLIVGYMLLSAVTITSVATLEMTIRKFFTSNHQLILPNKK